jgi:hypothetical protein
MKTYTVVGAAPVVIDGRGVRPGETVTADLTPEQEAFFFTIGALAVVTDTPAAPLVIPPEPVVSETPVTLPIIPPAPAGMPRKPRTSSAAQEE